jgi:hypothetical protein
MVEPQAMSNEHICTCNATLCMLQSCKYGKHNHKNDNALACLCFMKLPAFLRLAADWGWLYTFLGCKPRSLIRVSLGLFDYSVVLGRAIELRLLNQ